MYELMEDFFDLNHDGEVDFLECAMEVDFFVETKIELEGEETELTELEIAGLDPEELEFMDANERREILEEAGLDPDVGFFPVGNFPQDQTGDAELRCKHREIFHLLTPCDRFYHFFSPVATFYKIWYDSVTVR